ncbi:hypothetical protein RHMOL_Rhmol04G0167200 [Rhododendron molle]|uniref:Uncharacterized protein n=1 Tax=Rhododendron molle TaxID=49168 RepID=A0ACC0P1E1_RHOML|nr:hypothetical protein RHMOL_Rhmol04G0167200 [Rhododendron molle]
MAGDLVADFPDLLQSNPPRIRVLGSPTARVSPRVDIIEMLVKASIPTTESTIDGPAVKQIRDLNQEDRVVVNSSAPHMDLQYFAPTVENEKIVVQPPEEVVSLGIEKWKDCVAGFFFFRFDKAGAFRAVIEVGPWHFWGRLLILKQWHPHMSLEKDQVNPKQQIWVAKRSQTVLEQAVIQEDPNKLDLSAVTVVPEEGMVSVPKQDGSLVVVSGPIDLPSVPVVELARGKAQSPVGLKTRGGSGSGASSSQNMFSVLQSAVEGNVTDGDPSSLLPTEDEFADGMIKGLDPMEVPAPKKGRGRNKKQPSQC